MANAVHPAHKEILHSQVEKLLRENLSGPMFRTPGIFEAHEKDIAATAALLVKVMMSPAKDHLAQLARAVAVIKENLSEPHFEEADLRASHQRDILETADLILREMGPHAAPKQETPAMAVPAPVGPGPVLTRKMVSQIAKAFDHAGEMSYLQRVDLIAKTIGFENQASLMAVLRAAEDGKSQPASDAETSSVKPRVVMAYGERLSNLVVENELIPENFDGHFEERTFETPGEVAAYLQGVEDGDGWMGWAPVAIEGAGNQDFTTAFFEARVARPGLEYRDWHNEVLVSADEDLEP